MILQISAQVILIYYTFITLNTGYETNSLYTNIVFCMEICLYFGQLPPPLP